MTSIADAVRRIKDDPCALIDPGVVEDACVRARVEWRDRVLTPAR